MGDVPNWLIALVSIVIGWIARMVTIARALGKREEQLATKEDLRHYVTVITFNEFKTDIKGDLDEIKRRQDKADDKNDRHHEQIINILTGGK